MIKEDCSNLELTRCSSYESDSGRTCESCKKGKMRLNLSDSGSMYASHYCPDNCSEYKIKVKEKEWWIRG